ncbi:MAG: hydrolase [Ectothiorhodospiraceae bacterium]|nr:hydrolase [Ectothiorhodospiraceae bacterium]
MIQENDFLPPAWLRSGHAQTLWPALMRRPPPVALREELLELRDGDCLRLAWGPPVDGPLIVILHGIGGCARSPYVLGLVATLQAGGMESVVMQFRGAGGSPNRLPRFFHAGETGDLEETIRHVTAVRPGRPLGLVGFSMGGIVSLNWLGERGVDAPVTTAVGVSVPLALADSARHLDQGFQRLYQWELVRNLKRLVRRKQAVQPLPIDVRHLRGIRSLWDFDEHVTGPLHGFTGAADYYRRCAPINRLAGIRVPTLLIQAWDDPFIPPHTLPAELPEAITLELTRGGGHVGFVQGNPVRPRYWLEERVLAHLRRVLS